jgi:hypothetical protein
MTRPRTEMKGDLERFVLGTIQREVGRGMRAAFIPTFGLSRPQIST